MRGPLLPVIAPTTRAARSVTSVHCGELIEAEVNARLDAYRCEQIEGRGRLRNGSRSKTGPTPEREIKSKMPKLRGGSGQPPVRCRSGCCLARLPARLPVCTLTTD